MSENRSSSARLPPPSDKQFGEFPPPIPSNICICDPIDEHSDDTPEQSEFIDFADEGRLGRVVDCGVGEDALLVMDMLASCVGGGRGGREAAPPRDGDAEDGPGRN